MFLKLDIILLASFYFYTFLLKRINRLRKVLFTYFAFGDTKCPSHQPLNHDTSDYNIILEFEYNLKKGLLPCLHRTLECKKKIAILIKFFFHVSPTPFLKRKKSLIQKQEESCYKL